LETFILRHCLANGIEVVVCPRDGANVVTIQCVIWVGSLDEQEHERGIAHFLEHMLFKGTKTRGVSEFVTLIEGAGGDSNAYTTFDKTVFHVTLPSHSVELGLDVLSDALFNSVFDVKEFEKEREVILEEIRRDEDNPGTLSGKVIYRELYKGTEAARPIIGFRKQIEDMSHQVLVDFWNRWYQPHNMSVVVAGNVSSEDALRLSEKYFGAYPRSGELTRPGSGRHSNIQRTRRESIRAIVIDREFAQSKLHVILGAPTMDSPDCPLVDTAAYVLGGSDVSRLQTRLQEQEAIVNAVGASSFSSSFEGIFEISAILEPKNIESACISIARELALISHAEPVTQQEINRAQAAARIARIHREETVDGVASAVIAGLSTPMKEKFENWYEYLANNFCADEMTAALNRNWDLSDALIVVACDKADKPDPILLEEAFKKGLALVESHSLSPLSGTKQNGSSVEIYKFEIGQGIKVIYRQIPDAKMFSLTAATEGGQRGETPRTAGTFYAMAGLLGLASERREYSEFVGRLEDMGAILSGFSGKDSFGITMQCTAEQVEEMVGYLAEAILEPKFPETQWQVNFRETTESIKMQADSFEWVCMRRLYLKVFGDHPYAMPIIGFADVLSDLTAQRLQKFFETWRDDGRWVFAAAGGVSPSLVQDTLTRAFITFKPRPTARSFSFELQDKITPRLMSILPKRVPEQVQVAIGGPGPAWSAPEREATDILLTALSGQGGRLFSILREDESLAYSVGPLQSQGIGGGLVGAYLATAREKTDKARKSLERELSNISAKGLSSEELLWARSFLIGNHEIGLQRTSSQAMTMALMELYGLGWDDFQTYPDRLGSVTVGDASAAARKYFETSSLNVITVGV
jgi:zinc protease